MSDNDEADVNRDVLNDPDTMTEPQATGTWKVLGELDTAGATGVVGYNKATTGSGYGVRGKIDSSDTDAAAVKGEATQTTGWTYGVHGVNHSDYLNAAAVRAEATGGATGLFAESAAYTGAAASTKDGAQVGMFGVNNADTSTKGTGYGVRGLTKAVGSGAAGVRGETSAGTGTTYGVEGVTTSSDPTAAGVHGKVSSTSGNPAAVKASGHVEVDEVGCMAFMTSYQSVPSAANTVVAYDSTKRDDFGGFDPATGQYTFQRSGDYVVEFQIDWSASFSSQNVDYKLMHNGAANAPGFFVNHTEDGDPVRSFSKPLWDMNAGESIWVEVYQNSGSDKDIEGHTDYHDTFLSVRRFG